MESVFLLAHKAFRGYDSIFSFLVGLAFLSLVVLQAQPLWQLFRETIQNRSLVKAMARNPRSPLGWLLVAGLSILLLSRVKWHNPTETRAQHLSDRPALSQTETPGFALVSHPGESRR